jgi:hypothetical protein
MRDPAPGQPAAHDPAAGQPGEPPPSATDLADGAGPVPDAAAGDPSEDPVRVGLIARLRAAVESGEYRVDADELARALVDRREA